MVGAVGGGGGSSGTVSAEYQISLRADKTELPVNIANVQAGQGVYRPFTTTLYVQATKNGQPIPGGEKIFACNVAGGLNAGSLYYLDGDPAHEKEIDDGNGGKITVRDGRYGPYVNWEKVNATLPKGKDPQSVTLEEALALIAERAADEGAEYGTTAGTLALAVDPIDTIDDATTAAGVGIAVVVVTRWRRAGTQAKCRQGQDQD